MVDCVTVWASESPLTVLSAPGSGRSAICGARMAAGATTTSAIRFTSGELLARANHELCQLRPEHRTGHRLRLTSGSADSTSRRCPCGLPSGTVPVDADDRAVRPDEPSNEEGDVSDADATVEYPRPGGDARVPEEPLGHRAVNAACRVRRAYSSLEFAKGYEGSVCRFIAVLLIRVVSRSPPSAALFGRGVPCSEGSRGRAVGHRGCCPEL